MVVGDEVSKTLQYLNLSTLEVQAVVHLVSLIRGGDSDTARVMRDGLGHQVETLGVESLMKGMDMGVFGTNGEMDEIEYRTAEDPSLEKVTAQVLPSAAPKQVVDLDEVQKLREQLKVLESRLSPQIESGRIPQVPPQPEMKMMELSPEMGEMTPAMLRSMADNIEKKMVRDSGLMGTMKSMGLKVGAVGLNQGKRKLAATVNQRLVDIAKSRLSFVPENDPAWDTGMAIGLPVAIKVVIAVVRTLSDQHQIELPAMLDSKIMDSLDSVAEVALEGVTEEKVSKAIEVGAPFLMDVIALGAGLATGQLSPPQAQAQLNAGESGE